MTKLRVQVDREYVEHRRALHMAQLQVRRVLCIAASLHLLPRAAVRGSTGRSFNHSCVRAAHAPHEP